MSLQLVWDSYLMSAMMNGRWWEQTIPSVIPGFKMQQCKSQESSEIPLPFVQHSPLTAVSGIAATHPIKISGSLGCKTIKANDTEILTLPQTTHFCFPGPLSIESSEQEAPRKKCLFCHSGAAELWRQRHMHFQLPQLQTVNWPRSCIQTSANLLRCSLFAEYSRKLMSYLSFAFGHTWSQPCNGEP